MKFGDYQSAAKSTAIYRDKIIYPALGLASEAGEVCGKIKKVMRDQNSQFDADCRDKISKELGDVLWYISAIASDLDLSLDAIAKENLDKLQARSTKGTLSGDGDNR